MNSRATHFMKATILFRPSRKGSRFHVVDRATGKTLCGKTYARNEGQEGAEKSDIEYWGMCNQCRIRNG